MQDELLKTLELSPADVPALPARLRTSLVSYLLRWQEYDSAQRCLEVLLDSHVADSPRRIGSESQH